MPIDPLFARWLMARGERVVATEFGGFAWVTPGVKKTDRLRSAYYAEFPERL
jgi:hypothetical protein